MPIDAPAGTTHALASLRLKIRQIYYTEEQRAGLLEHAIPYHNPQANHFLENQVILDCFLQSDHIGCDYYGVLSPRFFDKTKRRYAYEAIRDFITGDAGRADVYSFYKSERAENVWAEAVTLWHPKRMTEIGQMIFGRLGWSVDILKLRTSTIFSNHWIAKSSIFARYAGQVLAPAMKLMETDAEIRHACFEDSKYGELFKDPRYCRSMGYSGATREQCLKLFGRPYYTYHPFLCERFFSTWLALNPDISLRHLD